jgi:lipoprotein NlpI
VSARYYRGIAYREEGHFDWAIEDFTKILEIDPKAASTYYHRALTYYFKKEYDKSWRDMKKAQDLGYKIPASFLDKLRKSLAK